MTGRALSCFGRILICVGLGVPVLAASSFWWALA